MIINPSYETIGSIFEKNILLEVPNLLKSQALIQRKVIGRKRV